MASYGAALRVGFCALLFLLLAGALVSATETSAQTPGFYDGSTPVQLTATLEASLPTHTPAPTAHRSATPTVSVTAEATFTPTITVTPQNTATPTATATPTITPSETPTLTPTPTHTDTPLYCPTSTPVAAPPAPAVDGSADASASCPITLTIQTNADRYWISEQAAMPTDVTARIRMTGVTASTLMDLDFTWTVAVGYPPADTDPSAAPTENISYTWPAQTSSGFHPFSPTFGDVVRGGTLILTAMTSIDGQPYVGTAMVPLLGRNPSSSDILAYFSSQFPSSYYTLWRIAQAESNLQQFTDGGYPKWSSDGYNGVGLMQITNPAPTEDEIWNWKRNADAGSRVLQSAYAVAGGWPRTVAASQEFLSAVDAYDAARDAAGLPPLTRVTVPDFTSGNFACNLLQREQDAVRLYNGAGGTDDLGRPLHEFKLAYDQDQGLLNLDVDEDDGTAVAQWVRVLPSDRPSGRGTANYVDIVLSKAPPGRC